MIRELNHLFAAPQNGRQYQTLLSLINTGGRKKIVRRYLAQCITLHGHMTSILKACHQNNAKRNLQLSADI